MTKPTMRERIAEIFKKEAFDSEEANFLIDIILAEIRLALPEKKKVLDLNEGAEIFTENEYVRHKQQVYGRNQAIEEMGERLR